MKIPCPVKALRLAIGAATEDPAFMSTFTDNDVEVHRIEIIRDVDGTITIIRVIGADASIIWGRICFMPFDVIRNRIEVIHGVGIFVGDEPKPLFEARVCSSSVHLSLTVHRRT